MANAGDLVVAAGLAVVGFCDGATVVGRLLGARDDGRPVLGWSVDDAGLDVGATNGSAVVGAVDACASEVGWGTVGDLVVVAGLAVVGLIVGAAVIGLFVGVRDVGLADEGLDVVSGLEGDVVMGCGVGARDVTGR